MTCPAQPHVQTRWLGLALANARIPWLGRLAAAVAVFMACACPCLAQQSPPPKVFEDWKLFSGVGKDGVAYAYTTTMDSKEPQVSLDVGKDFNQCDKSRMFVSFRNQTAATKSENHQNIRGELRVDDKPVHKITGALGFVEGSKISSLSVNSFENPGTVLPEMFSGQIVRFRFFVNQNEYFYRFSLKGFQQSFELVQAMCAKASAAKAQGQDGSRQQGAGKPRGQPQPKGSDADYFGPGSSPAPKAPKGAKSDKDFF